VLTFPERVTPYNIERLKLAILNGHDVHPGANYVISANSGFKKYVKFGDRSEHAERLRIGDTVERHVVDGEYVPPVTCSVLWRLHSLQALSCSIANLVCTRYVSPTDA
jgi:DNA-directed RNA polymerase beta' subunit